MSTARDGHPARCHLRSGHSPPELPFRGGPMSGQPWEQRPCHSIVLKSSQTSHSKPWRRKWPLEAGPGSGGPRVRGCREHLFYTCHVVHVGHAGLPRPGIAPFPRTARCFATASDLQLDSYRKAARTLHCPHRAEPFYCRRENLRFLILKEYGPLMPAFHVLGAYKSF